MGRYGYVALLVVCLGWFAYQRLRVTPQDDPAPVVSWSGWGEPVSGTTDEVSAALEGVEDVVLANHNAPNQVVLSR